jgi:hypothetical protein
MVLVRPSRLPTFLADVDASAGILYLGDPTGLAPGTFLRARLRR